MALMAATEARSKAWISVRATACSVVDHAAIADGVTRLLTGAHDDRDLVLHAAATGICHCPSFASRGGGVGRR